MIPFLDIKAAYLELQGEIDAAIARVSDSGRYIGGAEVDAFEKAFAVYCEAGHCIGAGNGFDALHLALRAFGIRPGDEVIVASNTFIATMLAVDMVGAVPVVVEPDPATYNLDPGRVSAAITSRTRVILPTHLYGQPADLDPLLEIAQRYGLKVLEDAAQAHGARYKGKRIGGHGHAVAWSFYPGKNLGAMGDGGAITTDDPEIARRIRMIGNYGSEEKYVHDVKGVNSRLDPIQAAVLAVKLAHLDRWNARRAMIAERYGRTLESGGVPIVPEWAQPSWHLYELACPDRTSRDALRAHLAADGVETLIHYPIPPHLQRAYSDQRRSCPVAERIADRLLSLPIGPHLSEQDQTRIVASVNAFAA